jgi:hypothetical protein
MTDTPEILPLSASADGKTNAFCHGCPVVQQDMNYAACLNRIAVIEADKKVPADWRVCADQVRFGGCPAKIMRGEEELAGKSIYYRARELLQAASDAARRWFMPGDAKPVAAPRSTSRRRPSGDAFDALGDAGSFADAINASAGSATDASVPAMPTPRPVVALPIALVNETPRQMALRLKAQREARNV